MALVLTSRSVTLTLRDNNRKTARFELGFPSSASAGDVVGAIPNVVPLVAALSNAVVVGATANFTYNETEPGTPTAPSEIERRLVLIGRAANGGVVRWSIPSASFALEQENTNEVSLSAGPVAALVSWLIANAGSTVGSPIQSVSRAVVIHRYRKP